MARLFLDFFGGWNALSSKLEHVVFNGLANECGFAAGYLRLRRLLPSSSEKPIPLWL